MVGEGFGRKNKIPCFLNISVSVISEHDPVGKKKLAEVCIANFASEAS